MKWKRYACCTTHPVHWWVALLLLALCAPTLAACGPGHSGGDEIAFLRGGNLWTISPDGSNLNQIESGGFLGVTWSPDHHQIVLRKQDGSLSQPGSFFGQGDSTSELGVTAIDGGNILQITPPNSGLLRSDAWWDASGNRLLYREEQLDSNTGAAGAPQWKLSQADQPAGIARKDLPASVVLPAVNRDGSLIASIDASGRVLLGAPGEAPRVLASNALTILPGSGTYPARPLWQPGTDRLVYAIAGAEQDTTTLLLSDTSGHSQPLLTIAHLQQYAWSPDGRLLLVETQSTSHTYQVYNSEGALQFAWVDAAERSLPFWSPDSRMVLVLESDGLTLINIAARSQVQLLRGSITLPPAPTSAREALFLRLAVNNPWKSDSSAFLFTNDGQGVWAAHPGQALAIGSGGGAGLYSSTVESSAQDARDSAARFPILLDWGEHQSVSWSTLDPNCAFLIV
jgi:dipeptidyl aminopeptidase/acylaminoacyl peptidase